MGSATTRIKVTCRVHPLCSIVREEPIVFDERGFGKGSVSFACTKNMPFALALKGGEICNASGNCTDYFIYVDEGLKQKWEDVRGTGKGFSKANVLTYPVYAYAKDISLVSGKSLESRAVIVLEH